MNVVVRSPLLLLSLLSFCTVAPASAEEVLLAAERRTQSPATADFPFDLPAVPDGQQVRLSLDARIDWPGLAGSNPWIVVAVNGTPLRGPALLNKPVEFTMLCGMDTTWVHGASWRILYSPDFSDVVRTARLPFAVHECDPYHFTWEITPYVKTGQNLLRITHKRLLPDGSTLVLRNVRVETGAPLKRAAEAAVTPAPTGDVPTFVAVGAKPVDMQVRVSNSGGIEVQVGERTLTLESRTSLPDGKWASTGTEAWSPLEVGTSGTGRWRGDNHEVERRVTVRDDHVHVADTITNVSEDLVGLIYENRLALAEEPEEVVLCGGPALSETAESAKPQHPTAMARWDDLIVGLVADDDVFRVHSTSFREPDSIGLADRELGIAPGKSHTLEWSLYPVPGGDYWDVLNAIRRNWGSIFTLPSALVFDPGTDGTQTAEYYGNWARRRGVGMICSGQTYFVEDGALPKGKLAEGTAIPLATRWCERHAEWIRKLRSAAPEVKSLIYVHAQICTEPEAAAKYPDSILYDAAGEHVRTPYHYPIYMYLSTLENSYGKALLKAMQETLDLTGADGFYCDEMAYGPPGAHAYNTAWDGCTALIDRNTHALVGKRSRATLLQQPWKVAMVNYLRERGKIIVGNSPAYTRTLLQHHVPRFTELASYSFAVDTHLGSPWALGNHDQEMSGPICARNVRRLLDHGAVYTTYTWPDSVEGPEYQELLYPITPVELREGMVLGEERILTNRSGRYGWLDGSRADVHIIDGAGKEVAKPKVPEIREGGRLLTEVRMPSDHFAILVRKPPGR